MRPVITIVSQILLLSHLRQKSTKIVLLHCPCLYGEVCTTTPDFSHLTFSCWGVSYCSKAFSLSFVLLIMQLVGRSRNIPTTSCNARAGRSNFQIMDCPMTRWHRSPTVPGFIFDIPTYAYRWNDLIRLFLVSLFYWLKLQDNTHTHTHKSTWCVSYICRTLSVKFGFICVLWNCVLFLFRLNPVRFLTRWWQESHIVWLWVGCVSCNCDL